MADHLALLRRWYYRGSRAGEIFLTDERGELPLRRVVRGVGRVFRGEKETPELSETARDYWVNRGKTVEFDIYPRGGQVLYEPMLEREQMKRNFEWFQKWITP